MTNKVKFWLKCKYCGDVAELSGTENTVFRIKRIWDRVHGECEKTMQDIKEIF